MVLKEKSNKIKSIASETLGMEIPVAQFEDKVKKNQKIDVVVKIFDKKSLEKSTYKNEVNALVKNCDCELKMGSIFDLKYSQNSNYQTILLCVENDKKLKGEELKLAIQKAGAKVSNTIPTGRNINIKFQADCQFDNEFFIDLYYGFALKSYRFAKYLTKEDKIKNIPMVKNVILGTKESKILKSKLNEIIAKIEAINLTRTLANEPANVIYPESFAKIIVNQFKGLKNVKVKVLGLNEIKKLGMNLVIGVAQGSVKEPKIVIVEYTGNPKSKNIDLGLVGKGVCFDSGGLSLKPDPYMSGMKGDMTGAATVLSSIYALAKTEVKVNAVAVGGMVENMPDGGAQRVDDIVKSMSGLTVEIQNTDAEGRLVLADIIYYTQTIYKPTYLIDMATLTGAMIVALGFKRAGIFCNNDKMADQLLKSGTNTGDLVWRMPLGEEYSDAVKSKIADIQNTSNIRGAGSATAAAFLENFISGNKNWTHIDIAGVDTWKEPSDFNHLGATGFGVKLLTDFVEKNLVK